MTDLALRGIAERDIDLLIAEELVASPSFASWIAERLRINSRARLRRVERSVLSATRGESDLMLTYDLDGRVIAVLIENKIDAAFQPRQAERYRERALEALAAEKFAQVSTAIIAPMSYQDAGVGFDAILHYEDLREWFVSAASGDARSRCKISLLDAALDRGRSGWTLVPDRATTEFWQAYWQLASEYAPDLGMPRPGAKPAASSFVRFRPRGIQKGVSLLHKFPYGNVDIQFAGQATRLDHYRHLYHGRLDPDMSFEAAGASLVNRIKVTPIPVGTLFEAGRTTALEALACAQRLFAWYEREMLGVRPK